MLQKLALTIIDGTVCVASTTTDYNEPRLITSHWPTTVRARDLANYLDIPADRLTVAEVRCARPGEYYIVNPGLADGAYCHGMTGAYVLLTHGGQTKPVQTDIVDYPAPKNRGKRVEYHGGYWHLERAAGWKRHESL